MSVIKSLEIWENINLLNNKSQDRIGGKKNVIRGKENFNYGNSK